MEHRAAEAQGAREGGEGFWRGGVADPHSRWHGFQRPREKRSSVSVARIDDDTRG